MHSDDLKKAGLKATAQRMKILTMLEKESSRHLSAEEIHQRLLESKEEVGLATVYRVLTQFEIAGLVTRHHFDGDHFVFELKQGHHHDHLVCIRCGKIAEFFDAIIEERQRLIAQEKGFRMTDHSLNIYGFCEGCGL